MAFPKVTAVATPPKPLGSTAVLIMTKVLKSGTVHEIWIDGVQRASANNLSAVGELLAVLVPQIMQKKGDA